MVEATAYQVAQKAWFPQFSRAKSSVVSNDDVGKESDPNDGSQVAANVVFGKWISDHFQSMHSIFLCVSKRLAYQTINLDEKST